MARKKSSGPSARDIAEVRSGRGSSNDRAELRNAGYKVVKQQKGKRYRVGRRKKR